MVDTRPYFHEVPQEEIDQLIKDGATWGDIMEKYQQPAHCNYPEALRGQWGCWSLIDIHKDGARTKISREYCKDCECYIPEENKPTA